MTTKHQAAEAAPELEAPTEERKPALGDVVLYWPPEHQERHVPGPWVAVIVGFDAAGQATLALMPPSPLPVGSDPVQRLAGAPFAGEDEDKAGKWAWRP
jgi:hypothetical protein